MASYMILLNFSNGHRKCIWLTYQRIAVSKPRCSPINQVLLYPFEHLYLYNSIQNVPLSIPKNTEIYIWKIERWVEATAHKRITDPLTAYSMHTFRLFCWTVTNNIFSAKLSIDAAVCSISSPTCSWWLPSSSSIAENAINSKISQERTRDVHSNRTYAQGGNL